MSRLIMRHGMNVEFFRNVRNRYGEPTEEFESLGALDCFYHENNGRIEVQRNNALRAWRNVQTPFLTTHMPGIIEAGLRLEDWCTIGNRKHTIGGIVDVQQWGIIGTITLEVVDNVRADMEQEHPYGWLR